MPAEVARSERLLYRPREAAELLGCSPSEVYKLMSEGVLPYCRLGAHMRLPGDALRQWIRDRTEQASERPD